MTQTIPKETFIVYYAQSPTNKRYVGLTHLSLITRKAQHYANAKSKNWKFCKAPETIEKMKSHRSNQIGKPLSEEIRSKISKANTGKKHSSVTKHKIRLSRIGKKLTETAKAKLSKRNLTTDKWRHIVRSDGKEFKSAGEAARFMQVDRSAILQALKKARPCKGYILEYKAPGETE